MKKLIFLFSMILVSTIPLLSQTCEWAESICASNNVEVNSIVVDGSGNIYIAGYFWTDTLIFNNSISVLNQEMTDCYIAKYNKSGICLWAEKINGNNRDAISNIALDGNNNLYIAGIFESDTLKFNNGKSLTKSDGADVFLSKYNDKGICLWVEKIAGSDGHDAVNCIAIDSIGNIFISGTFNSSILNFNNGKLLNNKGNIDGYIAQYTNDGICQWAENISGNNDDVVHNIAVDNSGNVYIIGFYKSNILYFNNGNSLINSGGADGFLCKYNNNGICLWAEKIAGKNHEEIRCITIDKSENIFIVGISYSKIFTFNNGISLNLNYNLSEDQFVSKYNFNGICQWVEKLTDYTGDLIWSIIVDNNGFIMIAGNFYSSFQNYDSFISKYKDTGIFQWSEKIAGLQSECATSITLDSYNNIYVGGWFESDTLIFNSGNTLTNCGNRNGFVAKYNQNSTSISNVIQKNYSISPNPATDFIVIKPSEGLEPSEGSDIQIFDMLGVNVYNSKGNPTPTLPEGEGVRIGVSFLAPGVYLIKIGNKIEKFVKM